jgi:hypothetical protein
MRVRGIRCQHRAECSGIGADHRGEAAILRREDPSRRAVLRCERTTVQACEKAENKVETRRHVQPNEMRLSCGATLTISQIDGLNSKTAPTASRAC